MPKQIYYLACLILLFTVFCHQALARIETMDDSGKRVVLDKPAQKIISLAPHLTELVFSAGAGKQLVAVSRHCDYPPQVQSMRKVSDYQNIDFELLALLQSDLVLVWKAGLKARQLSRLQSLTKAVYISAPAAFSDIAENLRAIGLLAGTEAIAQDRATVFLQQINNLRQRYSTREKVPVVYLLWLDPPMTITRAHWINAMIELCGGQNRYAEMPGETIILQNEALWSNPNVLILHSVKKFNPRLLPQGASYFDSELLHRPSLRIAQAGASLCQVLETYRRQAH